MKNKLTLGVRVLENNLGPARGQSPRHMVTMGMIQQYNGYTELVY